MELGAAELAQMTRGLDDSKKLIFQSQYASEKKDRGTAVILAIFSWDRFWFGEIGLGILKWITLQGFLLWWLIDVFTAGSRCDNYNRKKAADIVAALQVEQQSIGQARPPMLGAAAGGGTQHSGGTQ